MKFVTPEERVQKKNLLIQANNARLQAAAQAREQLKSAMLRSYDAHVASQLTKVEEVKVEEVKDLEEELKIKLEEELKIKLEEQEEAYRSNPRLIRRVIRCHSEPCHSEPCHSEPLPVQSHSSGRKLITINNIVRR